MAVPYTFSTASSPIPLSELDSNFSTPITLGTTSVYLGNTTTTIDGLTLTTVELQDPTVIGGTFDTVVASTVTPAYLTGCNGGYGNNTQTTNFAAGTTIQYNTSGTGVTAIGQGALANTTFSVGVTAVGYQSQGSLTAGNSNTAIGYNALYVNKTGTDNTAVGTYAQIGTAGASNNQSYNTCVGSSSLYTVTTGSYNSALGGLSLNALTTGSYNVAVGYKSLQNLTTGAGNTMIAPINSAGTYAPPFNPVTESNRLILGSTGVTNAYVQVAWTVVSDARDKTNFAPVPYGLDFVSKLEPTSYQFTVSRENPVPIGIVRYGFKAQDIMALEGDNPVIIDAEDPEKLKINSDSLIPVLVNAIKELKAELDSLKLKVGT